MRVVVPFAVEHPKTRLQGVLDPAERQRFARAMLVDVLEAVAATGHDPDVLATAPIGTDAEERDGNDESVTNSTGEEFPADAAVTVDDRPLTPAVNALLADTDEPVAVVMADLPLATPAALSELFAPSAGVVLAPGRGGGTNALVARDPSFRVDYHGVSYRDHRRAAEAVGASVTTIDSYRLGTDVDEPTDLAEVLLHGSGAAREWLVEAGFSFHVDDGRVGVRRTDSE